MEETQCQEKERHKFAKRTTATAPRYFFMLELKKPFTALRISGFELQSNPPGIFGEGVYFSNNDSPDYDEKAGKTYVIIADVIIGDVFNMKKATDRSLQGPPDRPVTRGQHQYDSVKGVVVSTDRFGDITSKVSTIYDIDQAYPRYLITYEMPP